MEILTCLKLNICFQTLLGLDLGGIVLLNNNLVNLYSCALVLDVRNKQAVFAVWRKKITDI